MEIESFMLLAQVLCNLFEAKAISSGCEQIQQPGETRTNRPDLTVAETNNLVESGQQPGDPDLADLLKQGCSDVGDKGSGREARGAGRG